MNATTQPSREDVAASFRRLRALKASFGFKPNKDDRAVAMIGACISEGFDTEPQILGTLRKLQLNEAHVLALLRYHTGDDPARHAWRLDEGGCFQQLE